jgi:hypothetical protein
MHLTLDRVFVMSEAEIQGWIAYFKIKAERQK